MLRVGIVLTPSQEGPPQLSAWVVSLLERMQQNPALTVALLGVFTPPSAASPTFLSPKRWSDAAFRAYRRWDARRSGIQRDALAPVPLEAVPNGIPCVRFGNEPETWTATLRSYNLDVLLWLDSAHFRYIPQAARLATWVLDASDRWQQTEMPPLWREHTSGAVITSRLLHVAGETESPAVVYKTRTAADPFSFAKTCSPVYWKCVEVVMRSLERLLQDGSKMLLTLPPQPSAHAGASHLGMARFAWAELQRRIRSRSKSAQRATFAKWCIGLRVKVADTRFDDPAGYRLMVSPRDRFYADPFLFDYNGSTWLFFEDFRYSEGRAVISCCAVTEEGAPMEPFEVLRLPHHLSYPFIFQHDDVVYMIPESRGNRTVSLYRATRFPYEWQHDTDLFTGVDMVDSTLYFENGRWWMFAGVSNGTYSNSDELCIYFADQLRGPWIAHPQNPVLSDVRRARPAGRLFRDGGRLIRPSQDCGPAYGYGLVFSEVEELTPESYRERMLSELKPESIDGNTANHTYTCSARLETIDRFFIESRLGGTDTFPESGVQAKQENA